MENSHIDQLAHSEPNSPEIREWGKGFSQISQTLLKSFSNPSLSNVQLSLEDILVQCRQSLPIVVGGKVYWIKNGEVICLEIPGSHKRYVSREIGTTHCYVNNIVVSPNGKGLLVEIALSPDGQKEIRLWMVDDRGSRDLGVLSRVFNGGAAWWCDRFVVSAAGRDDSIRDGPGVSDPGAPQNLAIIDSADTSCRIILSPPETVISEEACLFPFRDPDSGMFLLFVFTNSKCPDILLCENPFFGNLQPFNSIHETDFEFVAGVDGKIWLVRPNKDGDRVVMAHGVTPEIPPQIMFDKIPGSRGLVLHDRKGGLFVVSEGLSHDILYQSHRPGADFNPVLEVPGSVFRGGTVTANGEFFGAISSWNRPFEFVSTGDLDWISDLDRTPGNPDTPEIKQEVLSFCSPDGTKVFVTLLRTDKNIGPAKTILYCYGGFGMSLRPRYIGYLLAWLKDGNCLAFAHVRGGGEFGQAWHNAGKGHLKINSVLDLLTIAKGLKSSGVCTSKGLGVYGHSYGGFLALSAMTRDEEPFDAVVSVNGLTDLTRYKEGPSGHLWESEFQAPGSRAGTDDHLAELSPYFNVVDSKFYPPTMLIASECDQIVPCWHSIIFFRKLYAHSGNENNQFIILQEDAYHHDLDGTRSIEELATTLCFFGNVLE